MDSLVYKPALSDTLARLRSLYERRAADRIFAVTKVPSQTLGEFIRRWGDGFCGYPDPVERADFWDRLLSERSAVEDDSVPLAYLSEMDQGLYGGLLGGEVQFMTHAENGWISSMVAPLLSDWSEFDSLAFDRAHPWFERYLRQLETFVEKARGKFGISHFILIDGLNFAFELMGATETYLSLDERPEMIRRATELAFEINTAVQDVFFDHAGLLEGGTVSNMCEWMPGGRIVSESVDPFHMTSVAYFETWGRDPIERILAHFDGGVVHIHGNGRHLLEAVSTVEGLRGMFLADDRGFPLAFDVLAELQARTGDLPLIVQTDFKPFTERLDAGTLPGGVLYKVSGVPDVDAANRLMENVREYRA